MIYEEITSISRHSVVYFDRKSFTGSNKMSSYNADEQFSDDEVNFGKLTLRELKHILLDKQPKTCSASVVSSPKTTEDLNTSLKILQAHSQPNLISGRDNSNLDFSGLNSSGWDMKAADDSFNKMENMVAKLCVSPRKYEKTEELNNTLEVIEYILNNPPHSTTKDRDEKVDDTRLKTESPVAKKEKDIADLSPQKNFRGHEKNDSYNSPEPPQNTPIKTTYQLHKHIEGHTTPSDMKHKPIFQTPAQPPSLKKPTKVDDIRLKTESPVAKKEKDILDLSPLKCYSGYKKNDSYNSPEPPQNTPMKTTYQPHKHVEGHATPSDMKHKPIFETLAQPPSLKKPKRDEKVGDIRLKTENPLDKKKKDVSDFYPHKINSGQEKKNAFNCPEPPQNTPVKITYQHHKHIESHTTPRDIKHKPIFETPAQPSSFKKPSATSVKKIPSHSNAYQHICSPVASYIKHCPIAPLIKDVPPKKPLPRSSSIPKLVKNTPLAKASNKENVNLPSIAYKSAKKTKVIEIPDEQKMPQSQWAKTIMTTLPRPTVMKHDHRELDFAKKKLTLQQEDSFADLSCHQADVSVCTQKSAFKANK